jgi:uncharacterized membrane protein YqjE
MEFNLFEFKGDTAQYLLFVMIGVCLIVVVNVVMSVVRRFRLNKAYANLLYVLYVLCLTGFIGGFYLFIDNKKE